MVFVRGELFSCIFKALKSYTCVCFVECRNVAKSYLLHGCSCLVYDTMC